MPEGEQEEREHNIKSNLENKDIAGHKWTFQLDTHNRSACVLIFGYVDSENGLVETKNI